MFSLGSGLRFSARDFCPWWKIKKKMKTPSFSAFQESREQTEVPNTLAKDVNWPQCPSIWDHSYSEKTKSQTPLPTSPAIRRAAWHPALDQHAPGDMMLGSGRGGSLATLAPVQHWGPPGTILCSLRLCSYGRREPGPPDAEVPVADTWACPHDSFNDSRKPFT